MTVQHDQDRIVPVITLGWRMRLAMETASLTVNEMVERLGVSRNTISRWTHDQGGAPKRAFVLQWAMITGVDVQWLETGVAATEQDGDGGGAEAPTSRV